MRVLVGPRVDLTDGSVALEAARLLAGERGSILSLREAGVRNLARPLTAAEIALLRKAMGEGGGAQEGGAAAGAAAGARPAVIGYVCQGRDPGAATSGEAGANQGSGRAAQIVVAVADHANLTWRSPLTGANDDSVGPRFPSGTAIYDAGLAGERLRTAEGMIVVPGVIAGVHDDERLNAFENEMAEGQLFSAVSSELVPVAIVAAHMGIRVAAVVIIAGS